MSILNVELKAKSTNHDVLREVLRVNGAVSHGIDHQVDTYFRVNHGRLKLREGNIENNLIHYVRTDIAGPKSSHIILYKSDPDSSLKALLTAANGVLVVVDKQREILYIDHVKFHIDTVKDLGQFVEIEAIDTSGSIGRAKLEEQCNYYRDLLGIRDVDLVSESYSDLIIKGS